MRKDEAFRIESLDQRTRKAIDELQRTITEHFPSTTFEVVPSPEEPESIWLIATADVDDTDEVGDLVLERVVSLIVDENISVHVIPVRTPERIQAARDAEHRDPQRSQSLAS